MELDPISDEPSLARRKAAESDYPSADVHHRWVLGSPGVDVGRTVVADVHIDHDAVEGRDPRHIGKGIDEV